MCTECQGKIFVDEDEIDSKIPESVPSSKTNSI